MWNQYETEKNISSDIFHFFIYDLLPLIFNGIAHSVPTEKERLCIKQSLSSAWNDFYLLFYFRKNKVNRIPCGEFIGSKT